MSDITTTREDIVHAILKEREYQESKWGSDFDDKNTINDWVTYICHYASKAGMEEDLSGSADTRMLVKAATLCFAALEADARNNGFPARHYDGDTND